MENWLSFEVCLVIEQELEAKMSHEWHKPNINMELVEELRDAIYRIKQCKKIALRSEAKIYAS